jgi:hypothetical protein
VVRGEEAVMGSLLGRLEAREEAARVRVEELRAEMAGLAERLAAAEELLSRLQITRQTVIEVLAGPDLPEDGAVAADAGTAAEGTALSGVADGATAPSVVAAQGPAFKEDGDGWGLPVAYRDVWEVLVDAGVPLRAKQISVALGLGVEPRHVEGMRSKLKRLVRRGWLLEQAPGQFSCAAGVDGVTAPDGGNPGQVKVKGSSS